MALPRQKFREIVFQLLYSHDFAESQNEDMLPFLMVELEISKKNIRLAQEQKEEIQVKRLEIDRFIAKVSKSYDFGRISRVERNILRLGVFELLYVPAVPPKVAITEAIRLSKKFGTPESAAFVNAILDNLYISYRKSCEENVNDHSLDCKEGQAS